jgi:hypothetical protein
VIVGDCWLSLLGLLLGLLLLMRLWLVVVGGCR